MTGIGIRLITQWVKRADLMRLDGVSTDEVELLAAVGVETVDELRSRRPDRLHSLCIDLRESDDEQVPSPTQLAHWVEQARALPPVIIF